MTRPAYELLRSGDAWLVVEGKNARTWHAGRRTLGPSRPVFLALAHARVGRPWERADAREIPEGLATLRIPPGD